MRVYKPTYKGTDGQSRELGKWWVELRDHSGVVRRFPAFTDKEESHTYGKNIGRLVSHKLSGEALQEELIRWLAAQPGKTLRRFVKIGLIDDRFAANQKPLTVHLEDFRTHLQAKGTGKRQIDMVLMRVRRIFDSCDPKCIWWRDINATAVNRVLVDLQAGEDGIAKQTAHEYLQALQEFANWMISDKRAYESPVGNLEVKVKQTDATFTRRALTVADVVKLLIGTRNSTRDAKMTGLARSLVYRLVIESAMRRGDFKGLKVASFDFEHCTVTLRKSKNGKVKVLPLRADTAKELQTYMANRTPGAPAFDMPQKTSVMLRKDLEAVGIKYENEVGERGDFHALRHTAGTWLAFAGAHPNVVKDILRHSDIRLTMDRYGHLFDSEPRKAVEALPNLSEAVQRATGTEGKPVDALGVKLGGIPCQTVPLAPSVRVGAQNEKPAVNTSGSSESPAGGQKSPFQRENRRGRDSNPGCRFTPHDSLANCGNQEAKPLPDKDLAKSEKPHWAVNLADLAAATRACPDLPPHVKQTILQLIKLAGGAL